jgi:transcriptional regulator with XRE-family HTH domain
MGSFFGQQLREWREQRGLSGNKLAQLSGLAQSVINGIELGRRPPSDQNLEAIVGVPEMDITLDHLRAWRDADKIGGAEGLDRIRRYVMPAPTTEVSYISGQLHRMFVDFEVYKRLMEGPASTSQFGPDNPLFDRFIRDFGATYSQQTISLLYAADGEVSTMWPSQQEAQSFLEATVLDEKALKNLRQHYDPLDNQWTSFSVQGAFAPLENSLQELSKAAEHVHALAGDRESKATEAAQALNEVIKQHGEILQAVKARTARNLERWHALGLAVTMNEKGLNLERLQAISKAHAHPMTPDEAEVIRQARDAGVWHPALSSPQTWNVEPAGRTWVFDILDKLTRNRPTPEDV